MGKDMAGALALAVTLASTTALAQTGPQGHGSHAGHSGEAGTSTGDTRRLVTFPDALRAHTLANMRDHLQVLGEIQALLAASAFDEAADLAESRLGLSSLRLHGAHEVARFMPQGMQDAGTAMHRAASRLARAATDASATGDLGAPLQALSAVTRTCVACHAAYRLQ